MFYFILFQFRWKYFAIILPTNQFPHISENNKIVCAICNKYFPPLSSGTVENNEILVVKMKFLSMQIDSLKVFVEENNLERRSAKWQITEDLDNFPKLDEEESRNIICGVYQLKHSSSYIQEYLDDESQILFYKEDPGLILCNVYSKADTLHPSNIFYGLNSQNQQFVPGIVNAVQMLVLSVSVLT